MQIKSGHTAASVSGRWHLVAAECPEDEVPEHRVDMVFHDEPGGLRGAILSRADGSETPLQTVTFNGVELRLKMSGPPSQPNTDTPFLVMAAVADRFEGKWDKPGTEHIRLKLVRARK
jgi:hypothetical protein